MGTNANSHLEQPAGTLLRLVSTLNPGDKGGTQLATICECDGSFCGSHEGVCGNTRFLNSNSFHRALACKPCTHAHGGLVLAQSARRRKVPDSPEIDEALKKAYRQPREYDPHGSTYPRLTLSQLATRFKRTRNYLRRRAEELNLIHRQLKRHPKWTDKEESIVERHAHLSPTVIHKKLENEGYERTVAAIRDRIYILRLRQDSPYYSRERLAKHLGVTATLVGRWAREGLLRGQNMQTDNPADPWRVHRKEIRRFIQRNPNAVDLCKVDQFWFLDIVFEGKIAETTESILRKTAKKKRPPSAAEQLEMFTYHDAGHAVMAYLQGRRVKSVAVGKRDGATKRIAAHPESDWFRSSDRRSEVERQILILFAGQAAQNLLTGRRGSMDSDYVQAKILASHVVSEEKERKAYLNWLWIRAQNILNDSSTKEAIKTLAQAVRNEPEVHGLRIVSSSQAKMIIEQTLQNELA